MKKLNVAGLLAGMMEQPLSVGFSPLLEQRQFAKTGVVNSPEGNSVVVRAIANADPLRATVGSVIVEALRLTPEETVAVGVITEALDSRVVEVAEVADAAAVAATLPGATGVVRSARLTYDGGAVKNAPMSNSVANGTGLSTLINTAIAAAKPNWSPISLVNKVEDILADNPGVEGLVVVDQISNRIDVYTGTDAQITAANAAIGAQMAAGALAVFLIDSTPAAATEGQFGE